MVDGEKVSIRLELVDLERLNGLNGDLGDWRGEVKLFTSGRCEKIVKERG